MGFKEKYHEAFNKSREKVWDKKRARVRLHTSFRRSYREDYDRELEVPGLIVHAAQTFKIIFKNWKVFCGLIIVATIFVIFFVGLMSEETYTETQEIVDTAAADLSLGSIGNYAKSGLLLMSTIASVGLSSNMSEVQQVFAIATFLIIWLTTIYLVRHIMNNEHPKLRDGLYNALTPLLSTFVVLLVAFIQMIPALLVVITYSAAVSTGFLDTPFYALIYFIFAATMILLSVYLISSSLIAMIAVTSPGLYPIRALQTASDLIAGRRTRFVVRIIYLVFVVVLIYILVMMPVIFIDLWLKSIWGWLEGIPTVAFFLFLTTCFVAVYVSAYLYLYYRRILEHDYQK